MGLLVGCATEADDSRIAAANRSGALAVMGEV
jgi:hypothetical protein